ncbi:hypothetical protein P746_00590 [Enterococcus faecalis CBRD01]|nr:hypothetical protein P746_00590 [Enterococcus faecalis CBRD01]
MFFNSFHSIFIKKEFEIPFLPESQILSFLFY